MLGEFRLGSYLSFATPLSQPVAAAPNVDNPENGLQAQVDEFREALPRIVENMVGDKIAPLLLSIEQLKQEVTSMKQFLEERPLWCPLQQ
jgi:hypothetical protein